MTTEEKARAYDEALDRMKHVVAVPESEKALQALKETIFPELAESKDEKIRKALIEVFKKKLERGFEWVEYGIPNRSVLDWLEKQNHDGKKWLTPEQFNRIEQLRYEAGFDAGVRSVAEKQKEQNSLDISTASEWLKKYVGLYMSSEYNEFHKCVEYDGSIDKERLINDFEEAMQKEQKPAIMKPHKGDDGNHYDMGVSEAQEYAINRGFGIPFNDGEVFVDERYITQTIGNILRWADEHPKEQKPVECIEFANEFENQVSHLLASLMNGEWVYDKSFIKHAAQSLLEYAKNELKPTAFNSATINGEPISTENQSVDIPLAEWSEDIIQKAIKEVGLTQHQIYWFKANVFPPKQEWSDEDEKDVAHIIRVLDDCYAYGKHDLSKTDHENLVGTLKSLRPQPHWKPNEYTLSLVKKVVGGEMLTGVEQMAMGTLYEQLKKLQP